MMAPEHITYFHSPAWATPAIEGFSFAPLQCTADVGVCVDGVDALASVVVSRAGLLFFCAFFSSSSVPLLPMALVRALASIRFGSMVLPRDNNGRQVAAPTLRAMSTVPPVDEPVC